MSEIIQSEKYLIEKDMSPNIPVIRVVNFDNETYEELELVSVTTSYAAEKARIVALPANTDLQNAKVLYEEKLNILKRVIVDAKEKAELKNLGIESAENLETKVAQYETAKAAYDSAKASYIAEGGVV